MSRRTWDDKFEDRPVGTSMWLILGGVAFLLILGWGIAAASFGLRVATAGIVGRGEAHIQIQSANNRIAQYNKFFDLCASVQTNEVQLDAAYAQLATASSTDEKNRLNANIAGLLGLRAAGINQYNADARKSYTDGQFRASALPYQLDGAYSPGGNKTSCVGY